MLNDILEKLVMYCINQSWAHATTVATIKNRFKAQKLSPCHAIALHAVSKLHVDFHPEANISLILVVALSLVATLKNCCKYTAQLR